MNTLQDALLAHTRIREGASLLISPDTARIRTYGATLHAAHSLAAQLEAQRIPVGGHIGYYLTNGLATATIFLCTMCAGRVVVPFNLVAKGQALASTIVHSEVALIFTQKEVRADLDAALALLPTDARARIEVLEIDVDSTRFSDHGTARLPGISEDDPALLMYTSGTTGPPKGALLTHANLMHTGKTVASWHTLTANDRVLSSLPLYDINGQCISTIAPFVSGGSLLCPRKFSVNAWWDWVRAWKPTWLNVVPTIIAYLLDESERPVPGTPLTAGERRRRGGSHLSMREILHRRRQTDFPYIRFARSAGAPLPPKHHRAFEERFGINVIEAMGMTECASMVFCNPQDPNGQKLGSPGLPCGVKAKINGADGKELSINETGEICLSGPNVMQRYFNEPQHTSEAFDSLGWLRTGDLGYRDADGYYFVTGRIKEMIIKGGENISPREIDEALLTHPDVLEAAAYAVPDTNYGQDIAAAVVLKPNSLLGTYGATELADALAAHCRAKLGTFKTPRAFHVVHELPKGASGKVQRLLLAQANS
jgi:long-chain acyl-CoA synthetase